jgi:hypothetical protein
MSEGLWSLGEALAALWQAYWRDGDELARRAFADLCEENGLDELSVWQHYRCCEPDALFPPPPDVRSE